MGRTFLPEAVYTPADLGPLVTAAHVLALAEDRTGAGASALWTVMAFDVLQDTVIRGLSRSTQTHCSVRPFVAYATKLGQMSLYQLLIYRIETYGSGIAHCAPF